MDAAMEFLIDHPLLSVLILAGVTSGLAALILFIDRRKP